MSSTVKETEKENEDKLTNVGLKNEQDDDEEAFQSTDEMPRDEETISSTATNDDDFHFEDFDSTKKEAVGKKNKKKNKKKGNKGKNGGEKVVPEPEIEAENEAEKDKENGEKVDVDDNEDIKSDTTEKEAKTETKQLEEPAEITGNSEPAITHDALESEEIDDNNNNDSLSTTPPPPEAESTDNNNELEQAAPIPEPTKSNPPALPPRGNHVDPPELPPRKRAPFFWLKNSLSRSPNSSAANSVTKTHNNNHHNYNSRSGSISSPDYDLILSRLDANSEKLEARDSADKDASLSGIRQLQENFANIKEERGAEQQQQGGDEIDWETWSNVINDYANYARNNPEDLSRAIAAGFPSELRGLIWQLITSSKSASMEEIYSSIQNEASPHEKAIKRDLSRTSFIQNNQMDPLFRIIKSYSLFDPDVGYTQGMAFITVPLLINLTEQETFCLLVQLMKDYGMRQFFLTDMPGLHLRLYQFDRILEDTVPDVHIHLARQGVRSSMYASQWFLTLFAYKFPLPMVLRILDIIIAEGIESLLRFAVALMKRNASNILNLEFDAVLPFLKENIFDAYVIDYHPETGEPQYSVGQLVADAFEVKVLPVTLRKYENEYTEIHRIERERIEEVETLRGNNGQLTLQVRRLETSLAALNQEHIQVANEMVQGKLEVARLQDENEQMTSELQEIRAAQQEGKTLADQELRQEMNELKQTNTTLDEEKSKLQQQVETLEKDLVDTKMKLATLDDSHSTLQTRWNELKKHIEGF